MRIARNLRPGRKCRGDATLTAATPVTGPDGNSWTARSAAEGGVPAGTLHASRQASPRRRWQSLPRSPARKATAGLPDRRQIRMVTRGAPVHKNTVGLLVLGQ